MPAYLKWTFINEIKNYETFPLVRSGGGGMSPKKNFWQEAVIQNAILKLSLVLSPSIITTTYNPNWFVLN